MFDMIDNYAKEHGCYEDLDFNAKLFELKIGTAESAFKMGVLAGVIFAGCSKEQVDRFERGLAFSRIADNRMVKGVNHGKSPPSTNRCGSQANRARPLGHGARAD
jgi:hypothetical protein